MSQKVISPKVKKYLKEYESESGTEYSELLKRYNAEFDDIKAARKGKSATFYETRALFKVKQSLRGRAGAQVVKIQGVVLGATLINDIAGKRRWNVINAIKDHLLKGATESIEEMINNNETLMTPLKEHKEMIDEELSSLENADEKERDDIQDTINFMRRQQADGLIEDQGVKYVIIPLETRQYFDDAQTQKNPNYGKPVNYADRRRMFIIGRTVAKDEVSLPKLLVVEARLDQCYNWNADNWDIIEGFAITLRDADEDQALLRTTRSTKWAVKDLAEMGQSKDKEDVKTVASLNDLLAELEVEDLSSEETRCHLLLSAPGQFQITIDGIHKMYGNKEWNKLMTNWDRFHIVTADLLNKSDIGLGFREQFLGEGTEPDSMDYHSKSMNFWADKEDEDKWSQFGVKSRVVFGGTLQDRQIWDSEARKMSDDTAACMDSVVFVPIPEYKEEP